MRPRLNAVALAVVILFGSGSASSSQARVATLQSTSAVPNVFGSVALPVAHSRYSARWARVVRGTHPPSLKMIVGAALNQERMKQASFVNAAFNRRLSYRFDAHPTGDYWAPVAETLAKSSGDCEDFVIAKMQALRSLGVPTDDLYMTIGTDAAVGAVHAVLLVRSGSSFWVLDNRSDQPVLQENYRDFHPILTFSGAHTWLHGYRRGTTPPAVRMFAARRIAQLGALPIGNSQGSVIRIGAGR